MPDLLAGTTVLALDTPPTVGNTQNGSFTFNATSYGTDNDSGVYVDCGVAFVACTTGRAKIDWGSSLSNNTVATFTFMSLVVRDGAVVGAGASVVAASDNNAIQTNVNASAQIRCGASLLVTGLTPGSSYNVRLEHRVSAGIATIDRRNVIVSPAT